MNGRDGLINLYNLLKKFHLSDSLYVIGAVNAALKYGTKLPTDTNVPGWVWYWLNREGRNEHERRSLVLTLSRMARFLLLSSANDYKGISLELENPNFRKAADAILNVDLITNEPESDDNVDQFTLYFSRIGQIQFPLQTPKKNIIGRGYMLFQKMIFATQTDYDFNAKFIEYFDLSLMEFMSTGFAMWAMSAGTLDYELKIEIPELRHLITPESQRIFSKLSSGTPQLYRELIRGENWKTPHILKDRYALDPFVVMPAVKVERSSKLSPNAYVVPQPKFLLDRASSGIFYLLADKERDVAFREGKGGKNPFRNSFGMVYRAYVGKHLSLPGKHTFIDLDHDFNYTAGKIPDFAVVYDDTCVLFEVKTTLLNIHSRSYFEKSALEIEVRNGNIQKAIKQINEFKAKILTENIDDNRLKGINTVLSVIVGYEDIYCLNSTLLPVLDEISGETNVELQFGCISDIEAISSAIDQDLNIVHIIHQKAKHFAKRQWAIATTFNEVNSMGNSLLDQSYNEFIEKMGVKKNIEQRTAAS